MAEGLPEQGLSRLARALRYTLAVLGGPGQEPSGVDMTVEEALDLAPVLAHLLVLAKGRVVALDPGIGDPAEQLRIVREQLQAELESFEIGAMLAAVDAEAESGNGGPAGM